MLKPFDHMRSSLVCRRVVRLSMFLVVYVIDGLHSDHKPKVSVRNFIYNHRNSK